MSDSTLSGGELKAEIRKVAFANRRNQEDKDSISRRIMATFMEQPEYQQANTVMFYVDVRAEVRTRHDLPDALASGKKIVVPWCNADGELELFHLEKGMMRLFESHPSSMWGKVASLAYQLILQLKSLFLVGDPLSA